MQPSDDARVEITTFILSAGVTILSIIVGSMFGDAAGWSTLCVMMTVVIVVMACVIRSEVRRLNVYAS